MTKKAKSLKPVRFDVVQLDLLALAQLGLELLPDGTIVKVDHQDPMSVQDNTAVSKKLVLKI